MIAKGEGVVHLSTLFDGKVTFGEINLMGKEEVVLKLQFSNKVNRNNILLTLLLSIGGFKTRRKVCVQDK